MTWGKRIYGLMDFDSPHVPDWAVQDRKDEIARVREWQRRRRVEFVHAVRLMLRGMAEPPNGIDAVRALIEGWQAAGLVPRYELKGDLWLARRLAQAGLVLEARRKCGVGTLPFEQGRLLDAWLKDCVSVNPDACIELDAVAENLHRWVKWRGYLEDAPSNKRLAAFLRAEGHKSVRRNSGVVFVGMWAGKPRSLSSPAVASAGARSPAQTP